MTILEIILTVIVSILFISIILVFIFFFNKFSKITKEVPTLTQEDNNKEVQNSINKLQNDLNLNLVKSFSDLNEKILKQNNEFSERMHKLDNEIQNKINSLSKGVNDQLVNSLTTSKQFFKDFSEKLGKIDEAQKNLGSLEDNVLDLTNILKGNQTRGRWGELTLSNLLASVFGDYPDGYSEQYTFKNLSGDLIRPDAVVFLPEPNHLICIDSKFPFSNYETLLDGTIKGEEKGAALKQFKKEVIAHVDKVKQYVVTNVTAPFAILFVPSDGIMWFINTNLSDVVDSARTSNVVLASPSSLHPLLATVNFFNKQVRRTKNLEVIEKNLSMLAKEFELFKKRWDTFTTRFDSLEKSKNELNITSNKITKKFDAIANANINQIEMNNTIDYNDDSDE